MIRQRQFGFCRAASVFDRLDLTPTGSVRDGNRIQVGLVRLRDFVSGSTVGLRRSAQAIIEQSLGRTLSVIVETSISNISVGLLPEVPSMGLSG